MSLPHPGAEGETLAPPACVRHVWRLGSSSPYNCCVVSPAPVPAIPPEPAKKTLLSPVIAFAHLLKDAGLRWSDDSCFRLGASLAYYAVFSIFPLLLLAVTVVGFFLGQSHEARARILDALASSTTPEFRTLFDTTLRDMQRHQTARGVGAAIGLVTLIFGASGVFSELQATLNLVWRVPPVRSRGFWHSVFMAVHHKALSFVVVLAAATAILATLVASAVLSSLGQQALNAAPGVVPPDSLWTLLDALGSVGLTTLVLAAMFRLIPEAAVEWRDVFGGALVTAVLFTAIKHMLAWYLAHLGSYAAYGAVGGFLCLLTWIYLASLFLFYGAEFSRVYAERYGSLARKASLALVVVTPSGAPPPAQAPP